MKELEDLLNCSILNRVDKGESLEKYHAILDDREVLLRIYSNDYYSNRFLREGLVLREIGHQKEVGFLVPKIVDEWPEYQIRAIEWFNFQPHDWKTEEIEALLHNIQSLSIEIPYYLEHDLLLHLRQTSTIHPAYREFFDEKVDTLLEQINWDDGQSVLIHGDFHPLNVGKTPKGKVLYDWEYATTGSSLYDAAYLQMLHPSLLSNSVPREWRGLVSLVIGHWYLQDTKFSPKEAIYWVEKISELL